MTEMITPHLSDVPETMLWTLHNRANEALRWDGILRDPVGVGIYCSINYDFEKSFRKPDGTHAVRAVVFDRAIRQWLETHPDGLVVGLGDGLETQCLRVDNGRVRWLSLDLPEAISIRERFLEPSDRFRHLALSALDFTWMDHVDSRRGLFITAQGLLMYFTPEKVRELVTTIARRFPGSTLMFDTSPRWMSQLTKRGWRKTPTYKVPLMPWGVNKDEIEPWIKSTVPSFRRLTLHDFRYPRGGMKYLVGLCRRLPVVRNCLPMMAQLEF